MKNKKAVVTLAIGSKYENIFNNLCRDSWTKYCEKYSCDLIVINNPLDHSERASKRSPAWQKLLILSQEWSANYDQIVWLDTDVLINNTTSKDITQCTSIEKIGAVEAYSIPSREWHDIALLKQYQLWESRGIKYLNNLTPNSYYCNRGIPAEINLDSVVQTGVFTCSAKHHKDIFEHIYFTYEDGHGAEWNYEMPAMSFELVRNTLVSWISPQFNFSVSDVSMALYPFLFSDSDRKNKFIQALRRITLMKKGGLNKDKMLALMNIYNLGYFMHFAGCTDRMEPLHTLLQKQNA